MYGIRRILVVKFRHIGDVLLTVPTLRAVREAYPSAYLAVAVARGTEGVLQGNPLLDEIIVSDRAGGGRRLFDRIGTEMAFVLKIRRMRFDLVIDLTGGDRAAILGLLSGARYRAATDPEGAGFWDKKYLYTHLQRRNPHLHTVEQNLAVVQHLGIDTQDRAVRMTLPPADQEWARDFLERHFIREPQLKIHLHPTARWLFKCWRDEDMAALIDRLTDEEDAQVFLTCGPAQAEIQKAKRIVEMAQRKPVDLIGKTTLTQLAALSQRCDLFVGVDTAPMHIAASVGTPVVALFGPTGQAQWRPWGEGHRVLQDNAGCDPSGPFGCARTKRCLCLEKISVDAVLSEIRAEIRAARRAARPTPIQAAVHSAEVSCVL